jgi:hypothetical protein
MKTFHIAALLGAASVLAIGTACDGGDKGTTDCETGTDCTTDTDSGLIVDDTDTTAVGGPPTWDVSAWTDKYDAIITCDGTSVTFQLRTTNWGYAPRLYLADTRFAGAWTEEHTLAEVETSPSSDGYSVFERTLTIVASANDQDPDVSTILGCERYVTGAGDESVTIAAAVYESDSTTQSDCIAFGFEPGDVSGGTLPGDAPTFATSGCTDANP